MQSIFYKIFKSVLAKLRKNLSVLNLAVLNRILQKIDKILTKIDKNWQKLTKIDKNWQKLTKIDKNWQKLTNIDKISQW